MGHDSWCNSVFLELLLGLIWSASSFSLLNHAAALTIAILATRKVRPTPLLSVMDLAAILQLLMCSEVHPYVGSL